MLAKSISRIETDTKKSNEEKQRQVLTIIFTSICNMGNVISNVVFNQMQFFIYKR